MIFEPVWEYAYRMTGFKVAKIYFIILSGAAPLNMGCSWVKSTENGFKN